MEAFQTVAKFFLFIIVHENNYLRLIATLLSTEYFNNSGYVYIVLGM